MILPRRFILFFKRYFYKSRIYADENEEDEDDWDFWITLKEAKSTLMSEISILSNTEFRNTTRLQWY